MKDRVEKVVDYAIEAREEDSPYWRRLFLALEQSGLDTRPEEIITVSYSAGGPGNDLDLYPFVFVGKVIKEVEFAGEQPVEELISKRAQTLDRWLQSYEDSKDDPRAQALQSTKKLFDDVFGDNTD